MKIYNLEIISTPFLLIKQVFRLIITSIRNKQSVEKSIINQVSHGSISMKAIVNVITVAVYSNNKATKLFQCYKNLESGRNSRKMLRVLFKSFVVSFR